MEEAAVSSSEVASPPAPPWIELPGDVTANILQRLGAEEILESAQKVCTTWRRVCQDPAIWRVIHLVNTDGRDDELAMMCRHAVDRSQGQLIDLSMHGFGDDELLNYVADRSSHLRRLTLDCCYQISGKGLTEAVKKLPHLEELHLTIMSSVNAGDVENIGISCPLLKSFAFDERGRKHSHLEAYELVEGFDHNDYARAIAKTMPNLCHLRLISHRMKNQGLQAILDGCPHLESLDLRRCFELDLREHLGKRCSEQIKDLRRPFDPMGDFWWLAVAGEASSYSGRSFSFESFGCYDEYYNEYDEDLDDSSLFGDNGPLFFDDDYY